MTTNNGPLAPLINLLTTVASYNNLIRLKTRSRANALISPMMPVMVVLESGTVMADRISTST